MKKSSLFSIFLLISLFTLFAINVNATPGFTVNPGALSLSGQEDTSLRFKFTITNTGDENLTFNRLKLNGTFQDAQGDRIIFTLPDLEGLKLSAGEISTTQIIAITIEDNVKRATYTGTLEFSANTSGTDPPTLIKYSMPVTIRVDPDVCSDGRVSDGNPISSNSEGFLRISDIDDPDDGDEFSPGETIRVRGTVENNGNDDMDVIVEAILYNKDQDTIIARAESESFEVEEDDDADFNFDLKVPLVDDDLDEGDDFILFIKVAEDGDEDQNCNYDNLDLELQRKDNQVAITRATVTPSQVMCSANVNFVVDVLNVGKKDDDTVVVRLRESELLLNYESDRFSLKKFDRAGDAATVTYSFMIPSNAEEKTYNVEAVVSYNSGRKTDSKFISLTVKGCGVATGTAQISLLQGTITATPGKLFGLPFQIKNPTSRTQTYTIEVNPVGDWAKKPDSQVVTLQAGQETTLYSYLTPKADLASGSYTINIEVKQAGTKVAEQTVTVQVGTSTGERGFQPSITVASVWRNLSNSVAFWIVAVIIVFALVIYVLSVLLKPK